MGANEIMGFIDVTPAMAAEWLEHNMPNNRAIKRQVVKQYAEDMSRGKWEKSYEPIVFNKDGMLENGQHRLSAICLANVPVTVFVIKNADSAPGSYDRGIIRSTRDALCVRGNIDKRFNQNSHIAVAKSVCSDLGIKRSSDAIAEQFLKRYGEMIDDCVCASRQQRGGRTLLCQKASILKILFYARISDYADIDSIFRFCLVVNSGFSVSERETAAIVMRNQLSGTSKSISGKKCMVSGYSWNNYLERLTAFALTDFVNGRQRRNVYNADTEKMPMFVDRAKKIITAEIARG